jgi:O-antigen/teichoic acid export membrane protein
VASALIAGVSAERTPLTTRSGLRSGALTGLGQLVLALTAAAAGALLANRFGRNAETDGFLAAYAVYTLLVLAAHSVRMILAPELTRAAAAGRLATEIRGHAVAFAVPAVLGCVVVSALAKPLGELVTGGLPERSAEIAGQALVILVPAAFGQLFAALAAAALGAVDSYGTAAAGFAVSGVVGLVVFAALTGAAGIVSLGWGLAASSFVALAVPFVALQRRGLLAGAWPDRFRIPQRLWRALEGAAVPLALQGAYLVELRFSAARGVGSVTSFTYAFLAASTLVGATGFALGVVSSAPLTRRGIDAAAAGRHVVHAAWVSLALVGAAAGVFALVGGQIVHAVLGDEYGGVVGRDLGLLVVYLSPWMVAWVVFAVTYPLVFVTGRRRWILPVAAVGLISSVPLGLALRAAWGVPGLAVALGLSTLLTSLGLLTAIGREALAIAVAGLARISVALAAACTLAFAPLSLVLPDAAAAVLGVVVYGCIVLALRSQGLGDAWLYVRGLR